MKRYDLMCGGHYADTEERDDQYGKYVKAEVAQALYDALKAMINPFRKGPESVDKAIEALSLAAGNGDE